MAKKKVYLNVAETPMKYFKFLSVTLVLGVFIRIAQLVNVFSDATLSWYNIFFVVAGFILNIVALIGMNSMQWYGILALFGIYSLPIIDSVAAIVFVVAFNASEPTIGTAVGRILGCLIVLIPTWIYFTNRRLLFDPRPKNTAELLRASVITEKKNEERQNNSVTNTLHVTAQKAENNSEGADKHKILFCRKCGAKLGDSANFCHLCGTKVVAHGQLMENSKNFVNDKQMAPVPAFAKMGRIEYTEEFQQAYAKLTKDQIERFIPGGKKEAATIVEAFRIILQHEVPISAIFEIYISVKSRLLLAFSPARIAITLQVRYAEYIQTTEQNHVTAYVMLHSELGTLDLSLEENLKLLDKKAQAIQRPVDSKNVAVNKKQNNQTYGLTPDDPVVVSSIPAEYEYLDHLQAIDGTIAKIHRAGSFTNAAGHLIDGFCVSISNGNSEKDIMIYLDGYGASIATDAPQGFTLK